MKKSYLILSRLLDLYSTRRLLEEAQKIYSAQVFHPESLDLCQLREDTMALPRLGVFRFQESLKFLSECSSLQFVNPLLAFARARDKGQTYQFLITNNLPTPQTLIWERFLMTTNTLELPGLENTWPLVVKKIDSSQGRGIYLARNSIELASILNNELSLEPRVLLQKMETECWGQDLRIFSWPGKNVAMLRQSQNGDFRSNLSLGGIGKAITLTAQEEELAQRTLRTFQLNYAGIDLLRTAAGPSILEVNPCPGLQGIEQVCSVNVAAEVVRLVPF